jgi:signal transduction histidine kinase
MVQQIMQKSITLLLQIRHRLLGPERQLRRWFRQGGFLWRGLLAWLLGLLIFFSDDLTTLDTRLKIRGNQDVSQSMVLLTLAVQDVRPFRHRDSSLNLPDPTELSDGAYWNEPAWETLLSQVLAQNPQRVVVTLFFSDDLRRANLTPEQRKIFQDPRIIWATGTDSEEKSLVSAFRNDEGSNIGSMEILRDPDGVIRRFPGTSDLLTLAEKTSGEPLTTPDVLINYRGDKKVFPELRLSDLKSLSDKNTLTGKIVFIGPESTSSSKYLTPLGPSSRHAVHAAMADHLLNKRTITRIDSIGYLILLLVIALSTLWVMSRIPPTMALVLLAWLATLWTALSIYIFDNFYFWLPISSVVTMILSSYVLLLGYQANLSERKNFLLQQEQKSLQELEQLKNNFVSLISHDLKTPIAKIQAILDRIDLRPWNNESIAQDDLQALRQSNNELNRYIQSILQVLRVESRAFRLNVGVFEINEIILEVWKQLEPLAKSKNIAVEFILEPIFSIEFDRTLIREVLVNIIDNAIKYSGDGTLIKIYSKEINGFVEVAVTDNGIGISAVDLPLIWGKFIRGKDQEHKTKGSGLGLYLVKFFIELHGGRVFAASELGKGTTLGFSLPVEQVIKNE